MPKLYMKYIAYVVKGLEKIAQEEIRAKIAGAKIIEVGDKRIIFEAPIQTKEINLLKTIDDLGLLIGIAKAESLEKIIAFVLSQNLNEIKAKIALFRPLKNDFSLTATFSRVKGFTAKEILGELADKISQQYHWQFTKFDHRNFDLKIFADHQEVYLSARLTPESLHHRPYKTVSRPGSLRPTVAAAMIWLAVGPKTNLKIVDNFCGSGTILAEAYLAGHQVFGGDIDPESVSITKQNLKNLGCQTEGKIKLLDATKTNWPDHFFDSVISNLPWNEKIKIGSITELYEGSLTEFARIVKPGGTLSLLVSNPQLLIKHAKKFLPEAKIETVKLGLLGQNPTIVTIRSWIGQNILYHNNKSSP